MNKPVTCCSHVKLTTLPFHQSMRSEAEADQVVFDRLQDELKRATAVNDKMTRIHSERDTEVEHYRQLVSSLLERWQAVFAQLELRQRELDLLSRHMNSYNGSYEWLIRWLGEARKRQEKIQAVPIGDSKALKEQLAEEKVKLCGVRGGNVTLPSGGCKSALDSDENVFSDFKNSGGYYCVYSDDGSFIQSIFS